MARFRNYSLSDTNYSQTMDRKVTLYKGTIVRAERLEDETANGASVEIAELYQQASDICQEILQLNLSQPAVYEQWKGNQLYCNRRFKEIMNILSPAPAASDSAEAPRTAAAAASPKAPVKPAGKKPQAGQPVQTASGFVTKNASEEVSASMIESWYVKEPPKHGFDDVKGMQEIKDRLVREAGSFGFDKIDEALRMGPMHAYCFYGPPGTGKTFIVDAFAAELMRKGFHYIKLSTGNIVQSKVGMAEKVIEAAFSEAIDNAPCVIFIDEWESVCGKRGGSNVAGHEVRTTTAFLQAFNKLRDSGARIVFIGATNYPTRVDAAMMDRVKMIRVPLPPVETREAVFADKLSMMGLEEGFTFRDMAELTENYSQRDIGNLIDSILPLKKTETIETFGVEDSKGELDTARTDEEGSAAILEKKVIITREFFQKMRTEVIPSDKTQSRIEMQEFERNLGIES